MTKRLIATVIAGCAALFLGQIAYAEALHPYMGCWPVKIGSWQINMLGDYRRHCGVYGDHETFEMRPFVMKFEYRPGKVLTGTILGPDAVVCYLGQFSVYASDGTVSRETPKEAIAMVIAGASLLATPDWNPASWRPIFTDQAFKELATHCAESK